MSQETPSWDAKYAGFQQWVQKVRGKVQNPYGVQKIEAIRNTLFSFKWIGHR